MKCRIGDICTQIVSGGTPKSTEQSYYENGTICWLNTKEVNFNRIKSTEKKITQLGFEKSSTKMIDINNVIIAMYGTTAAKVAINKIPLCTNQACCNLKIDSSKADYNYVYYCLKNNYSKLFSLANGGAQQNLNSMIIKEFEIDLPTLDIQKKISRILLSLDNKIELNNDINNNLYDLGNTIFKEWQDTCVETKTIGELSDNIIKYSKGEEEHVKLLNSSDVTEGIFIDAEIVPNTDLKGHFKKKFEKYDILYSEIRPRNKHYGYVLFDDYDTYIASTRLMVIRSNELISSSLLYFSILSSKVLDEFTLKTESRSGTFPQGNYEDMSKIEVPFSSNQENITKQLDAILNKINSNHIENKILSKLRDTLLPKLMNGEIDLDSVEI